MTKIFLAEYDMVILMKKFQDIPAGTKGVILMLFDGGSAVEVEFSGVDLKYNTYTVPSEFLKHLDETDIFT